MAQVIASYSGRPAFQLRYDVSEASVSHGTNQSTVNWHVYAICVDASYDSYNQTGGSYAVYMDGVLIASGTKGLDFRNSYYGQVISIASGTRVLNHAANGTKTASFSASHTAGNPFGTASTPTGYHNATTINRVPGAPTIGTITGITSSGASVPWSGAVANGGNPITTYNYRVGTTSGGSDVASGQDSSSPLQLSGLTRKTTYYVQVQAVSATGVVSAWSAAKSFTTLAQVPVMGTTYSAGSITRNSAVISGLSVTDNGGEAPSNARVQYNTYADTTGASVVTRGSWGNVTITGLAPLTKYYYRCAAYNSAGWSAYPSTWKSFTTLDDAPDDMAPPTISSVTNTSFTVQWVAPNMNGATFVAYQWALSLSTTFATVVDSGTTTATSLTFTNLTPGTRYYFRVRANATPNNSGYGFADQLTTGIAPNSGLRMYAVKDVTGYQQISVARTNLVTNPKPLLGSGSVEYRRNHTLLPVPTSTTSYSFQNKSGGSYTSTLVTEADDGPVPDLATYLRRTVTSGVDSGTAAWGPYSYTISPGPVVAGSAWTVSVYVRCSTSVGVRLAVSGRTGGASQGTIASGSYVTLPAGQWVRLSTTLTADAAAEHIGWWVNSQGPYPTGMTFDTTGVLVEKTDQVLPYFDGSTTYDPLLVPSWTGTPGASASVLTAQVPTGWGAGGGETAVLVTDDDGEPCAELIDPVGGGNGTLWVLNGAADTPGVGRWVALGVDVKPLTADQASRMRLHVRTRSGSTWAGAQSTTAGAGWTAGQWTRQVVSVQQADAADRLDAIIWPTQTPNPGAQFRARRAVVAFADTKEEAEAAVATYFDGSMPDTPEAVNAWTGAEHASTSTQGPGVRVGVLVPVRLYTFINGVRKQIKPMYAHDGTLETE